MKNYFNTREMLNHAIIVLRKDHTLKEVGEIFGTTGERIRQLEQYIKNND